MNQPQNTANACDSEYVFFTVYKKHRIASLLCMFETSVPTDVSKMQNTVIELHVYYLSLKQVNNGKCIYYCSKRYRLP